MLIHTGILAFGLMELLLMCRDLSARGTIPENGALRMAALRSTIVQQQLTILKAIFYSQRVTAR